MSDSDIQINRIYDASVMLMAIYETVCPDFLKEDIQNLLQKCFDNMPEKFEMIVYEKE
jgi:hypothetical protein